MAKKTVQLTKETKDRFLALANDMEKLLSIYENVNAILKDLRETTENYDYPTKIHLKAVTLGVKEQVKRLSKAQILFFSRGLQKD